MAPSGRTTTRSTSKTKPTAATKTRTTRQPRKTNFKKQKQHIKSKKQEIDNVFPSSCSSMSSQDLSKEGDNEVCEVIDVSSSSCSTPKGQKFKIPEISTCPPAPKKPTRVVSSNCSLRRSQLSFFSPPDLEHFFVALRDVLV
ncbi:hypothetical protein TanjilG_01742 [Lupinus angustifolius]|uniref:Uncharacterized protein n=1 Tax=Lupinus angustifolius TaxID=3871 RepID=A0A1J7GCC6_LUPAN|nr:PREDICTED: uncharacterized protein LOC109334093 [Lupinus angustifolius]OIV92033.1 hypothetical protein TanjilG_01742 [Lupinus angustifolius]